MKPVVIDKRFLFVLYLTVRFQSISDANSSFNYQRFYVFYLSKGQEREFFTKQVTH